MRGFFLTLTVGFLSLFAAPIHAQSLESFPESTYREVPWADGDSFLVQLSDGREFVFRLYYVDCPESDGSQRTSFERIQEQSAFFGIPNPLTTKRAGIEAGEKTREWLAEPFTVHTSFAKAPSGQGGQRYYAFIELEDGTLLGEKLITEGWARVHGTQRRTPDGTYFKDHAALLEDLQLVAAVNRNGVWTYSDFSQLAELREGLREEGREFAQFQAGGSGAARPDPGEPLDLNTASLAEIKLLPGIGATLADRILVARPFTSIDDLSSVNGIGPATLERIRPFVTVEGSD